MACFIVQNYCAAQLQASTWYFGDRAGLSFKNDAPVALIDGRLSAFEGCSTICDALGNLLFYTDGVTVYNRLHQSMPNGHGLWGSYTTTQTLIIPKPGVEAVYFIFSALAQFDFVGPDSTGFHYSIVDMNLDAGLGDVSQKNVLLFKNTTEKMSAIHHANGSDIWLVTHEYGNNTFRSYPITIEGIGASPVFSSIGSAHVGGAGMENVAGYMKLSPDGSRLALALYEPKKVEVFDFDAATGQVTGLVSSILVSATSGRCYGIEFSANSNMLYYTVTPGSCGFNDPKNPGLLWQYSLKDGVSRIIHSYVGALNALQLAINGKIYVSRCNDILRESDYVGVINFPNRKGDACGYISTGTSLRGNYNQLGLPNFIQSYFLFPDPVVDMPNVFSPNGDDYNPVFRPFTFENMMDADLQIINRWGQEVFHTKEVSMGWNGGDSSSGVYYWLLRYEGKNGKTGVEKGWVQLIR